MQTKSSVAGHALAFGAILLVVIALSAAWIFNVRSGPPLDGWTGGVTIIFVPFLFLVFSVVWLLLRLIVRRFLALSAINVAWVTGLLSYLFVMITCGPVACFANTASSRRMGFFLVIGTVLIALTHHFVLSRFAKPLVPPRENLADVLVD